MIQKFQEHLRKTFPNLKEEQLLLAFSGGVDSCVLLELCLNTGLRPAIAHCNFQLRGKESDADGQWVEKLSQQKSLTCYVKKFDTKAYAKQQQQSIQMAARELRYAWFEELCDTCGFTVVLVAHHADDSFETFLINATRGTGLKGLLGIPESREKIIRPLLPFSKAEIIDYANQEGLAWVEDASNATDDYLRNALRHQVIPTLDSLQPQLPSNVQRTLKQLREAQQFIADKIQAHQTDLFQVHKNHISISIPDLKQLYPLEFCLHELFTPYGFYAKAVAKLLHAHPGKILLSASHRLLRDRDVFLLTTLKEEKETVFHIDLDTPHKELPVQLRWETFTDLPQKPWKASQAVLDKNLLKFPIFLRKSKEGDYFYPSGMKGKKLLSKYYKDEKYSLLDKENQWVLCSEDAIVWVVGKRCDRRFTATDKTIETLLIHHDL